MFGLLGHSDSGTGSRHPHSSVGCAVEGLAEGALFVGLSVVGSGLGALEGLEEGPLVG